MKWKRYRFYTESKDYRPVIGPPPGPYWCSGYAMAVPEDLPDKTVLIAYIPEGEDLLKWWPEAEVDDFTEETEITFTSRFPRPDWWKDG